MGGNARCRQRRVLRGHSRTARSGLCLRSAHRLVVRPPRTPPWRGVGAPCARHSLRPEVGPPALRYRRGRPRNVPHHRVGEDRPRSPTARPTSPSPEYSGYRVEFPILRGWHISVPGRMDYQRQSASGQHGVVTETVEVTSSTPMSCGLRSCPTRLTTGEARQKAAASRRPLQGLDRVDNQAGGAPSTMITRPVELASRIVSAF